MNINAAVGGRMNASLLRRVMGMAGEQGIKDMTRVVEEATRAYKHMPLSEWQGTPTAYGKTEWAWVLDMNCLFLVWPLANGRWVCEARCTETKKRYVAIRNTSGEGKEELEALLLWQSCQEQFARSVG